MREHEHGADAEEGSGQRQAHVHADAPRENSEAEAGDSRGQREGAHHGCGDGRAQPALDQVRGLVQAHPRLHRKDSGGVERQQPEGRRAQRLFARERRLLGRAGRCSWAGCGDRDVWRAAVGQQADILRPPHQQQPGRHEADQQYGDADRQPARAPAVLLHGEVGDQGQHDEAHHLRQVDDRARQRAPLGEPAIEGPVDADVERAGEVHAGDAEEDVERQQRLRQRQQHHRYARHRARPRTASCGRRAGRAPGRSAARPAPP